MTGGLSWGIRFREGSGLRPLEPVLKNWVRTVEEYTSAFEQDACWSYTERANVGVLAGAAWRTKGWLALEEYSTTKRCIQGQPRNGRCDLYLLDRNEGGMSFAVEAKQARQNMGKRVSQNLNRLDAQFADAWRDAGQIHRGEGDKRVAACFVMPRLPLEEADTLDEALDFWLNDVREQVEYDALAWVFPEEARRFQGRKARVSPGVVLVMQERQRATRAKKG